ncbi:MAG: formylglycine-generating enzyme family protein [Planctomycetaceae bacterium]|jgi:formylglycine-generating enzyme|nr:formylglycine-generating enzyme family protein [Planctomycetaceae bacterium]MDG2390236.1 formylglycine-generating enzyme family protein [Planctomycetaceae bacterium]
MMKSLPQMICLFTSLSFLMGCGSDDPSAPTGDAASTQVQPNAVGVMPTPVGGGRTPAPSNKSITSSANPVESDLPPGVSPDDVFELSAAANTVEIAATSREHSTFVVVSKPLPGTNSNTFANPKSSTSNGTSLQAVQRPVRQSVGNTRSAEDVELPEDLKPVIGGGTHEETGLSIRMKNEKDDTELILIPAGNTIRGSNTGPENTSPEHHVYLDNYYICEHEVTLAQYQKYRDVASKVARARAVPVPLNHGQAPNMPALGIPQQEARKYAEWAGGMLPTEAQWEKAARGPAGYKYPWGNGRPIWPDRREPQDISAVKSYRIDVSMYGVHDLSGNAREWVQDVYTPDAYLEAGENGQILLKNPTGPRAQSGAYERVIKGGDDWKAWNRSGGRISEEIPTVGFRYVVPVKKPEPADSENETPPQRSSRP